MVVLLRTPAVRSSYGSYAQLWVGGGDVEEMKPAWQSCHHSTQTAPEIATP